MAFSGKSHRTKSHLAARTLVLNQQTVNQTDNWWLKILKFSKIKKTVQDDSSVCCDRGMDPKCLWLTTVLSMWSCRASISRSPTGCQAALTSSAWVSRRSSWSMELCSSWRRSKAWSTWLCQPPMCPFRRSQRSLTSPVCLRIARAKPRAFSSGVRSGYRALKKAFFSTLHRFGCNLISSQFLLSLVNFKFDCTGTADEGEYKLRSQISGGWNWRQKGEETI